MLRGIDISHHNGSIDYRKLVDSGEIEFIIAKATEGRSYTDKLFVRNMKYCREFGILHGAYHYVRGDSDALSQARHFIDCVDRDGDANTLLALDVEDATLTALTKDKVADMVYTMVAEIYDELRTYPVIYVSEKFMHPLMFAETAKYCGGWLAKWGDKKPFRQDLNCTIWQYSARGKIAGISGDVDLDRAYLNPENWIKIANPTGERS